MTKEEFLKTGLCEQFVLGLTTPEESALVVKMLEKHPELMSDCMKLENCMEKYARAHAITPPEGLRKTILDKIDEVAGDQLPTTNKNTSTSRGGIFIPTWAAVAMAASFVGVLFFSFFAWDGKSSAESKFSFLETEYRKFQEDCSAVKKERKAYASLNNFLQDPETIHVHLRGTQNAPDALAVVFWNETKDNAYLKLVNLPPPPQGKTYQMWADINDKMVDMGTFKYTPEELITVPYMVNAASLNVTLEKEGGSDHPDVSQLMINGVI
ncbi:MAG: anti-sigma factor [Bacteroidota bacterium]